uniref:Uncharacterized protein n=1 Tax=Arundo donax TaxID=35708 RepID=A0A0A9EDF4_ARUDO
MSTPLSREPSLQTLLLLHLFCIVSTSLARQKQLELC